MALKHVKPIHTKKNVEYNLGYNKEKREQEISIAKVS